MVEEKEYGEMITTQTYSIKIKNKIKVDEFAKKKKMNKSKALNKIIEDHE